VVAGDHAAVPLPSAHATLGLPWCVGRSYVGGRDGRRPRRTGGRGSSRTVARRAAAQAVRPCPGVLPNPSPNRERPGRMAAVSCRCSMAAGHRAARGGRMPLQHRTGRPRAHPRPGGGDRNGRAVHRTIRPRNRMAIARQIRPAPLRVRCARPSTTHRMGPWRTACIASGRGATVRRSRIRTR
jgi:hypothetical protein